MEDKLTQPVVCHCGFSTMSAKEAVKHADKHWQEEHPESQEDQNIPDDNTGQFPE